MPLFSKRSIIAPTFPLCTPSGLFVVVVVVVVVIIIVNMFRVESVFRENTTISLFPHWIIKKWIKRERKKNIPAIAPSRGKRTTKRGEDDHAQT
jgi:hypothetical protein